jgi:hypothetical protein
MKILSCYKHIFVITFAASAFAQCDATLWNHVYNKSRLHVIKKCVTVTGTIDRACRKEKDGDKHCFLKVDKQFEYMLNSANMKHEFGDLVFEPICVNRPTQKDAVQACKGFSQSFPEIKVGNRVAVTGDYVNDTAHQHQELHPVSRVAKLP